MTRVHAWDELTTDEPYPGIFRQVLVGTQSTVTRYTYHAGSVFPVHQHPEEQITVVHSGEIELEIAGQRRVLHAGEVAVIPGNTPHGARVVGETTVVTDNYIASARRTPLQVVGEDGA